VRGRANGTSCFLDRACPRSGGTGGVTEGSRGVLPAYADVVEWSVSGGTVVTALISKKLRIALVAEGSGATIADTAGDTKFVTDSAAGNLEDVAEVSIFSYTPTARTVASDVGAPAPNTSDGNPGATT
jgi:hypothetical protein